MSSPSSAPGQNASIGDAAATFRVVKVSFREKIDRIAVDGTVDHCFLKQATSFESPHSSLQLDFDLGLCRIADDSGEFDHERDFISSYKKLAPRCAPSSCESVQARLHFDFEFGLCHTSTGSREFDHQRDLVASYKKLAPRSALPYIKNRVST